MLKLFLQLYAEKPVMFPKILTKSLIFIKIVLENVYIFPFSYESTSSFSVMNFRLNLFRFHHGMQV